MEKDIDRIEKNPETDIVIRIDDFGGNVGLTIREFVKSDRYTGFTKSGTRIPADKFKQFKDAINSIDEADLQQIEKETQEKSDEQETNNKENDQQKLDNNSEESNSKEGKEEVAM